MSQADSRMDRRAFLRQTAAGLAAVGASGHLASLAAAAEPDSAKLIHRNENPEFVYRRLGRTNFNCGRIVAGWIREENLLRRVVAKGVNYLDTARGYGEYEVELRGLLKRMRDKLWITSKATGIAGFDRIAPEVEKQYRETMAKFLGNDVTFTAKKDGEQREVSAGDAPREIFLRVHEECVKKMKATGESPDWRPVGHTIASMYARMLDESLERLQTDHVDCYFMHGIEIPWIFQCTELWEVYEKAHKAGKVKHFGFSTHQHQKEVLAAAVEANAKGPWKIDLVMPGVHPISFHDVRPELEALKKQDVGVITMKTSGKVRLAETKTEKELDEAVKEEGLNDWERAKAYMLHATDGLVDACIAAVSKNEEIPRTLGLPRIQLAAAERRALERQVMGEMRGACRLCGNCTTACPEHIAVSDILRYHAYVNQYNDRELALALYRDLGYDPSALCSKCGKCTAACPESIDLARAVNELAAQMRFA